MLVKSNAYESVILYNIKSVRQMWRSTKLQIQECCYTRENEWREGGKAGDPRSVVITAIKRFVIFAELFARER